MITVDAILVAARECLGTPFRHQGRMVGRGLDCAGVLEYVSKSVGEAPVDVKGYPRRPDGNLAAALDAQPFLVRVTGAPQSGDFLLFHYEDDAHPGHLGICAGDNLIHAWAHAKKVAEHGFTPEWRRRLVRTYRFRELIDGW